MSIGLKNLVFHPNTFFEEITYENKNLLIPFVFVALMGLFGIMLLWRFSYGYSLFSIVEMMALPFILWVIVTLVWCCPGIFRDRFSFCDPPEHRFWHLPADPRCCWHIAHHRSDQRDPFNTS